MEPKPLWTPAPDSDANTRWRSFSDRLGQDPEQPGSPSEESPTARYRRIHRWSIENSGRFWAAVWEFAGVIGETGETPLRPDPTGPNPMLAARWFPEARLNFAENLLRGPDGSPAVVAVSESGSRREVSFAELRQMVSSIRSGLEAAGVRPGDRVAAILPNGLEAIAAMLAATSLGAIWSSCSPDFGATGILDRFRQIEPKVLFAADGYVYGGKPRDALEPLADVLAGLPSLALLVPVRVTGGGDFPAPSPKTAVTTFEQMVAIPAPARREFCRLPFDHPLYILFSSGTTGRPKCIVHRAGGVLLQHLKEHLLHTDVRQGDRVFYYTTCGWMMWNWLVSALACEATVVTYDGSPLHPDTALFDLAEREQLTHLGTSAKHIDACRKRGVNVRSSHRLDSLRTILSTGSPLVPEGFDYIYESVKTDVCLSSISGGTDIVSCFVLGNPVLPVWRGQIQCPGLGMDIRVFDESGQSLEHGTGELVCAAPFPSMPLGFWGDRDGSRYRAAYFERFPGVWHHGDFVEWTDQGGMIVHGRSDAVLNPGGVRIGTAEIYRQVEGFAEIEESICVGQSLDGDVRVILFVKMSEGYTLDSPLREAIRQRIMERVTRHHVPARVVAVPDIPRTRSGKITELAVRDVIHGRKVQNVEALTNPEALEFFATPGLLDEPET